MKLNFRLSFLNTLPVISWPVLLFMLSCQPAQKDGQFIANDTNDKIFGGALVTEEQLISRHIVGIKIKDSQGQNQVCSGIILSVKTILTAGHCAVGDASQLQIIYDRNLEDTGTAAANTTVARIELHPQYLQRHQEIYDQKLWDEVNQFDAAILHLNTSIQSPYKAIRWNFNQTQSDEPQSLQLAGYGAEFYDQLTSERRGSKQLKSVNVETKPSTQDNIIFFNQTQGKGSCVGDSGGPAYYQRKKRLQFVGLLISIRNKGNAETCYGESRSIRLSSLYSWLYQAHRKP